MGDYSSRFESSGAIRTSDEYLRDMKAISGSLRRDQGEFRGGVIHVLELIRF